jgi:hypothetical protein
MFQCLASLSSLPCVPQPVSFPKALAALVLAPEHVQDLLHLRMESVHVFLIYLRIEYAKYGALTARCCEEESRKQRPSQSVNGAAELQDLTGPCTKAVVQPTKGLLPSLCERSRVEIDLIEHHPNLSPGSMDFTTRCPISRKCAVAGRPLDESQQPT